MLKDLMNQNPLVKLAIFAVIAIFLLMAVVFPLLNAASFILNLMGFAGCIGMYFYAKKFLVPTIKQIL